MKKIIAIFWVLSLLISSTLVSSAQEENWKQIIPFKSTINDVERILGKPRTDVESDEVVAFFTVKTGNITIYYSLGHCDLNDIGGWNVEEGLVEEMKYYPGIQPRFKSLKIDRKKYEKKLEGDTDDLSYINKEDGIKYIVRNGIVRTIIYFPGNKFDNFRCSVINNLKE